MKHMEKKSHKFSLFESAKSRALEYERTQRIKKIKECMALKDENEKLWDMTVKQRMAISAIKEAHAKDMAEMTESLRKAHAQLAAAEAERDRYREALRRTFPKEAQTA